MYFTFTIVHYTGTYKRIVYIILVLYVRYCKYILSVVYFFRLILEHLMCIHRFMVEK